MRINSFCISFPSKNARKVFQNYFYQNTGLSDEWIHMYEIPTEAENNGLPTSEYLLDICSGKDYVTMDVYNFIPNESFTIKFIIKDNTFTIAKTVNISILYENSNEALKKLEESGVNLEELDDSDDNN